MKPEVSIIIPTRNSAKTIELCIKSIEEQTYQNHIEKIVVDTQSTDNTISTANEMQCKVISTKAKTLGARYEGFKASCGDYILMLDSDQILDRRAVEFCIALSKKYDMLCLEEMSYMPRTFLERLYQADRRLIHQEFDLQKDPIYGAMAARFYKRDILDKAFKCIPELLFPFVKAAEESIIYYEASKISNRVTIVPNAVWHIELTTLTDLWKKNFHYGKSIKKLLKTGYYNDLVKRKDRLRKTSSKISKDKLLSSLLLMLKAPAYLIGFYS